MRNYWRYVLYVWRYKALVLTAFVASLVAETLNFASVGALCAAMHILVSFKTTGAAGSLAEHGVFESGLGRRVVAWLGERATPDAVLMETMLLVGVGFLIVVLVRGVLDFLRTYLMHAASNRGWTDLTNGLFDRISGLSMRFFTQQSIGGTMSRFGPDLSELRRGGRVIFEQAAREPFRLIGGLVCTAAISLRLSAVTLLALPIALYIIKVVGDYTRRYTRKSLQKRADAMKILGETVQAATVIKAYDAEDYQRGRFRKRSGQMLKYLLRREMVRSIAKPVTDMLYWVCRVAVVLYGVHLVIAGHLEIGTLVFFVYCVKQVYDPLSKLRKLNVDVQRCVAAADRVFELIDTDPEVSEKPDAVVLAPVEREIRFDHVSFAYEPPNDVVHDFDLTVRAGEVVAIVGENGSGKSTVVNLLLRFYDPTAGSILIDGTDIRDATFASLRRQIGLVSQNIILFNDTVRHNIAFGDTHYTDEEVEAAARAALAHDFIVGELPDGYDTVVGEGGAKLSGGQRQRIALARALLRDPRILVLDEATSAMDVDAEDRFQSELARFARDRTVVLISHRFSALRYADRIVAMAGGRIEGIGTHAELLEASPTYRNLHHKQSLARHGEPAS